jgi:hypothetical protein
MLPSMDAFWHRDSGPSGFYDFKQQIVVLPNLFPRPSVVIDHESTHVSVINCSSIGLIQHVSDCARMIGHELHSESVVKKAERVSAVLMRRSEDVHEAAAWFGTELTSLGFESIRAPDRYRAGVLLVLRTILELAQRAPRDDQLTFSGIMHIIDAIATYALSPPILTHYLSSSSDLQPERLERDLRKPANDPNRRFKRLCAEIARTALADVEAWADWVFKRQETKGKAPKLAGANKWFWPSRSSTPMPLSLRPSWDTEKIHVLLRSCCEGKVTLEQARTAWQHYYSLYTCHPDFDRYSHCCLVERPVKVLSATIDRAAGEELLMNMAWVRVSVTEIGSYEGNQRPLGNGEVLILSGSSEFKDKVSMRLSAQDSHLFLAKFVQAGGGIVAVSPYYDFANADFPQQNILADLPHAVMAITDVKSLWVRLALFSEVGIRGSRTIEYLVLPSKYFPEEFGYLLLKPQDLPLPIIVNPIIIRNHKRALSIVDRVRSPFGTRLEPYNGPLGPWVKACGSAVAGAVSAFDRSLEQPPEVLARIAELTDTPEFELSIRQKLARMLAR